MTGSSAPSAPEASSSTSVATRTSDSPSFAPRAWWARQSGFVRGLTLALVVATLVRAGAVMLDDRTVGLAGIWTRDIALRWADGHGYTTGGGAETAVLPPAWPTLLGLFSVVGARGVLAHQVFTLVVGLGLVAVIGLVARDYIGDRAGVWAAFVAALYPGFWLLDLDVSSQSLTLLLLGALLLAVRRWRRRPAATLAVVLGALCGLVTLARPELFLLLLAVVVPLLVRDESSTGRRRAARAAGACGAALLVLAPWAVHNAMRFDKPVAVSTETGFRLLAGNCPPGTFDGDLLGYSDPTCAYTLAAAHFGADEAEMADLARREAFSNLGDNIDMAPLALLARLGRLVGVFRPSATIDAVAASMAAESGLVWAWTVMLWILVPAAVLGVWRARRPLTPMWPLLVPAAVVVGAALATYGEPQYRGAADLVVVVLGGAGLAHLWSVRPGLPDVLRRNAGGIPGAAAGAGVIAPREEAGALPVVEREADTSVPPPEPWSVESRERRRPRRPKRLPAVIVPKRGRR